MMRRLQLLAVAVLLVVAALTTGAEYLFFLVYLGALVVGGAWLITRLAFTDLEAGFAVDRPSGHVGDQLAATTTVRSRGWLPKLWLEIHHPTTLPVPIPGRAIALGPHGERSWAAHVPLTRRGHYRIDPMVVRAGDPLGLFESWATVGASVPVVVYPRLEDLAGWKVPPAPITGPTARSERSLQTTPLVTSIRPYVPGDAFNRIHWRSSARHQELQVKEFDIEQTADVWLFLDLDRSVHVGADDLATIETAARVCASIGARAIADHRALGFDAIAGRRLLLPADRGQRQQQKVLHLLAAVQPDGPTPLFELLLDGLERLRRGMAAIVVTPALERAWVRPLAALRTRGAVPLACIVDPLAHEEGTRIALGEPGVSVAEREAWDRELRALRHELAEHDVPSAVIGPGPLAPQLVVPPTMPRVRAASG
jgi:uncharacterized protein (DUF58 family)